MFPFNKILCSLLLALPLFANAQGGFLENKGQLYEKVNFKGDFGQYRVFLDDKGFTLLLHNDSTWGEITKDFHDYTHLHEHNASVQEPKDSHILEFQSIKYEFVGGDWSHPKGFEPEVTKYNYFIGNNERRWATDVRKFQRVLFKDVYPNIDIEFLALGIRFKYNIILRPGADIEDIVIKIDGADYNVDKDRIQIDTRFGPLDDVMPISYWVNEEGEQPAKVWYEKVDGTIRLNKLRKFKFSTLVIDPELIFSTYSGSSLDNFGFTATYDEQGNLYSGGIALEPIFGNSQSNGSYPVTVGAFDVTFNGGDNNGVPGNQAACDISLSKYTSDGSTLLYATYLGGSSNEYPHSLIVDNTGNMVMFGTTYSLNFPTSSGAYQRSMSNVGTAQSEIVISKFNSDGTVLMGSSFIGGSSDDGLNTAQGITRDFYADEFRGEVNVDAQNNIYVATSTTSDDFPTTAGVFQPTSNGGQEGVVFSFNQDISQLRWSTYFGGKESDALYSVDISLDGTSLLVGGGTNSDSLPTTTGVILPNKIGSTDGIIARLSIDGSEIERMTYYGTTSYDQVIALEIDANNKVYAVGQTAGSIPQIGGTYGNPGSGQFLIRLEEDFSKIDLSTTFGSGSGSPDITINAFLVDECGKLFVSGWGGNINSSGLTPNSQLRDMPIYAEVQSEIVQSTTDGNDFYIVVFSEDIQDLVYGSYFGGNRSDDHVDGGTSRFDKRGVIYQSVCASCPSENSSFVSDFPTTGGSYSPDNKSYRCSNAAFKFAAVNFNLPPKTDDLDFLTDVADTVTVTVFDTFDFSYTIYDAEGDSIFAIFEIPEELRADIIEYPTSVRGKDSIQVDFRMLFTCKNAGDTFRIKVRAMDDGCPLSTVDSSEITIAVQGTEPLPPPEVFCLYFQDDGTLRLEWQDTDESDIFYRMFLYKTFPDGTEVILDTMYTQDAGQYIDTDVVTPRDDNYEYHLRVEDICGFLGDSSLLLGTVKESEIPVEATYIKTVTVNNGNIEVHYGESTEPDFDHYEIYRGGRNHPSNMVYYTSIFTKEDTVFTDSNVDVSDVSYCYEVRVADNCGRASEFTDKNCSIVIRGESINEKGTTPRYRMDLTWDNYIEWTNGVESYELIRSVDTGILRPLVKLNNPTLSYTDGNLDYDWGGYWYSVVAYQNPGSHDAQSRSNDIYLIQPPEVYVPNAVTANGDNLNDSFGWADVFVKEFEMKLFNRWGEKVFESTDKNTKWDGDYKSDDLSYSNVYFWIVTYTGWDGNRHIENGTVTFIK